VKGGALSEGLTMSGYVLMIDIFGHPGRILIGA
jgi:hypothetical protein